MAFAMGAKRAASTVMTKVVPPRIRAPLGRMEYGPCARRQQSCAMLVQTDDSIMLTSNALAIAERWDKVNTEQALRGQIIYQQRAPKLCLGWFNLVTTGHGREPYRKSPGED
jgi:hypothetical protein